MPHGEEAEARRISPRSTRDQSYYWPEGAAREETVTAYVQAFAAIGYEDCGLDASVHPDFEKIAIYSHSEKEPQHAARQLHTGMWTSKLGKGIDIRHTLLGLAGEKYGKVTIIMKRPKSRICKLWHRVRVALGI